MGNIVYMMSVSADGFIEGPDRDISWHRVDDQLHRHFNVEPVDTRTDLRLVETHVFGNGVVLLHHRRA
jgi:hypothetical protein